MMTTILQIIINVYDQVTDELEIPVGEQHRITFTSRYNSQGSTYPWTFLSLLISKLSSQVELAKPAPSIPVTSKLRIPSGEYQWTKNWAVTQLNHTLYCQYMAHRNALAFLHPFVPLASPKDNPTKIDSQGSSTLQHHHPCQFQNRVAQHVRLIALGPILPVAASKYLQERSSGQKIAKMLN